MPEIDTDWMGDALCAEIGPTDELFFPTEGGNASVVNKEVSKICNKCNVKEICLRYALDNHIWHGSWGGLSPNARKRLFNGENNANVSIYT